MNLWSVCLDHHLDCLIDKCLVISSISLSHRDVLTIFTTLSWTTFWFALLSLRAYICWGMIIGLWCWLCLFCWYLLLNDFMNHHSDTSLYFRKWQSDFPSVLRYRLVWNAAWLQKYIRLQWILVLVTSGSNGNSKKEKCQKKKSLFINCMLLDKEDIIWHSYYSLHDNETTVYFWYKWQLCPTRGSILKSKSLLFEINCKSLYVFGT